MIDKATKDHGGFSLVELIVVIAIMAIVGTASLISLSLVSGQNIKRCYRELEGYMQETKMRAMSRENEPSLTLYIGSDGGVYVELSDTAQNIRIGKRGLTVKYTTASGATEYQVSDTQKLKLGFERSSGAFKKVTVSPGVQDYCTSIILTDGRRTYTMKLVPKTGKYYRE
jgi:prepilin-type N-terminal cleavage/methylation domain-containing protein